MSKTTVDEPDDLKYSLISTEFASIAVSISGRLTVSVTNVELLELHEIGEPDEPCVPIRAFR